MTERLKGRVAVITGGAGGIGQAIAERLASEGASIAVADVASTDETKRMVEEKGQRFLGIKCDVSAPADVQEFAACVSSDLGPVDILVNNAIVVEMASFEDVTFDQWKSTFAVNVHGYFLMVKAVLGDLKRSKAGRIINMSSTSFWRNVPSLVPYVAAKGGVFGFTNALATDLGKYDITVNAIAPGLVRTPATRRIQTEARFAELIEMQVLKKELTPADVAGVASFLASDDASLMTGQVMVVDGGLTRR